MGRGFAGDRAYRTWCLGIVRDFLDGTLMPDGALRLFQDAFKDRPGPQSDEEYRVLNEIFLDFEDYVPDRHPGPPTPTANCPKRAPHGRCARQPIARGAGPRPATAPSRTPARTPRISPNPSHQFNCPKEARAAGPRPIPCAPTARSDPARSPPAPAPVIRPNGVTARTTPPRRAHSRLLSDTRTQRPTPRPRWLLAEWADEPPDGARNLAALPAALRDALAPDGGFTGFRLYPWPDRVDLLHGRAAPRPSALAR